MQRRAFTLVELIMVMVIVAILSIASYLSLAPHRTVKLDAAAKRVLADLQYAQGFALSTSQWVGVSFEVDPNNTYTVYETNGVADTPLDNPSKMGSAFVINLNALYNGVKITQVLFDGGSKVEFHPLGTPYADYNGNILNGGQIRLEYAGESKDIWLDSTTGRITLP